MIVNSFFKKLPFGVALLIFLRYNTLNNKVEEIKMILSFLADEATQQTAAGGWISIAMIGVLLIFMWLVVFRPQRKQEKEAAAMRDNLQVGDEITTIGGIIGKIVSIKEETVMIETGNEKTKMRILRSAVKCVDVHAEDAD